MFEEFIGTKPVEERQRIDFAALSRFLGFEIKAIEQFKGGQSNPTYELITPGARYVLRRKPPGKLLPSAHAVDREFRVISALHPTGFPVARPYALCEDEGVIGTMFYVMEKVEGRIFWDGRLPELSPVEQYAALTGRSGVPELDWYFAYNLFRLAAICQGIAGRVRDGTAASAHALVMAERVEPLGDAAWSFARKAGA